MRKAMETMSRVMKTGGIWMLFAGMMAGVFFNLAFGTVAWDMEGITGGMISALLIHCIS